MGRNMEKVAFSTQELSERRQDRNEDTIEEQQEFALSIDAKINDLVWPWLAIMHFY